MGETWNRRSKGDVRSADTCSYGQYAECERVDNRRRICFLGESFKLLDQDRALGKPEGQTGTNVVIEAEELHRVQACDGRAFWLPPAW